MTSSKIDELMDELQSTIDRTDSPDALVAFLVSDYNDQRPKVRVFAAIPPGSADDLHEVISAAFAELAATAHNTSDAPVIDRVAQAFFDCDFADVDDKVRSMWAFNDSLISLLDALVAAKLVRSSVHDWYWPFRNFLAEQPFDLTDGLRSFVGRGPDGNDGDDLAGMVITAVAILAHFDPVHLPDDLDSDIAVEASNLCGSFLDSVFAKLEAH